MGKVAGQPAVPVAGRFQRSAIGVRLAANATALDNIPARSDNEPSVVGAAPRVQTLVDFDYFEWDDPDEIGGNVDHIGAHGITTDEVEEVLCDPDATDGLSRSSGRPMRRGWTSSGKFIAVVYSLKTDRGITMIRPITAFEVDPG